MSAPQPTRSQTGTAPPPRLLVGVMALLGPLSLIAALLLGHDPIEAEGARSDIHRREGYVGSTTCRACHPDQHASWDRTFHASMTSRPSEETVLGRFDGQTIEFMGRTGRVFREGERFLAEVPTDRGSRTTEVALVVGSRRYQQYFEREERPSGSAFVRLPFVWHVEAERWLHVNTIFLHPDEDNWQRHASDWNSNCVFCHNTAPRPGAQEADPLQAFRGGSFDSQVGELGIACEACHGPGQAHAERQRDPRTRIRSYASDEPDPDIVHPGRLQQRERLAVCGQCHGQRVPLSEDRARDWLANSPTYRPADVIEDHVALVDARLQSPDPARPSLFSDRFWNDETPRLTAYELQGVLASPCVADPAFTCGSCHSMHLTRNGDPRGMLEPAERSGAACLECHAEIARDVEKHTRHAASGPGSDCYACHMPAIVYGILDVHRSHRIESPDPRRDVENGRPHACTLCHADRTAAWAASELTRGWPGDYSAPRTRPDGAPLDVPEALASLLAGDAVQRAVYAKALGNPATEAAVGDARFAVAHLATTLGDRYGSVRWIAHRSLLALDERLGPDLGDALARFDPNRVSREPVEALWERCGTGENSRAPSALRELLIGADGKPLLDRVLELLELQTDHIISIGE